MERSDIRPNGNESILNEEDFIVSKTDVNSKIIYGNEIFIKMSGWTEKELLGSPQNIIRHPDMPRVAFKSLYDYLKSGREWFGYVKNLKKDGGYYWVFANISPNYDSSGRLIGYYSVRRKPRHGFKNIIEPLYRDLLSLEKSENNSMNKSEKAVEDLLKKTGMGFREIMIKIQRGEINEL